MQEAVIAVQNLHTTQLQFSRVMLRFFGKAARLCIGRWSWFRRVVRLWRAQRRQAAIRRRCAAEQVPVPPLMILSATRQCNLRCNGCYSRELHTTKMPDMDASTYASVIAQAQALGVGTVLIAGGEPLLRADEILGGAGDNRDLLHVVFTNGTLLNRAMVNRIAEIDNVIPVLSLEGAPVQTDRRRGNGVYESVLGAAELLHEHGLFFGASFTATSENLSIITADGPLRKLHHHGCRLFFYIDYVPVAPGTEALVPTPQQRAELTAWRQGAMKRLKSLFVTFPGDEEQFGGCLASGRGFVHVNPAGGLEPCPFAPYSDVSLTAVPLRQALSSSFLAAVRADHANLGEVAGGCALWRNQTRVASILGAQVA